MNENNFSRFGLALRIALGLAVVVALGAGVVSQVVSQEKSPTSAKSEPPATQPTAEQKAEELERLKMWQELTSPGENHKLMEQFVGQWNLALRMWTGDPGTPPVESKGSSEAKSIFSGRYVVENLKSELMMPDPITGQPKPMQFEGIGTLGYDNYKNLYVYTWIDNGGTAILTAKGTCDPAGKVLTLYGEMDEPVLGIQGRMVKYVTRFIDQDKHVFEMYDLLGGEERQMMEMTYTRKK
jgi:hypothetical protein